MEPCQGHDIDDTVAVPSFALFGSAVVQAFIVQAFRISAAGQNRCADTIYRLSTCAHINSGHVWMSD